MLYMVKVSGEIPLKSRRTRPKFESRLVNNIKEALLRNKITYNYIRVAGGIVYVECDGEADKIIKDVFGVHKVCKVTKHVIKGLDDVTSICESSFKDLVSGKKFAVRVRRVGAHDFKSIDVAREVGNVLRKYSAGVDLEDPDVEVNIEIRDNELYIFDECVSGVDGLPIGVEGKVLMLVSGGYDSIVASWLIAKRGVEVDFLHYIMGNYENLIRSVKVIKDLGMKLYGYQPRLYLVDLSSLITYILRSIRKDYGQVVLRRFMYMISMELAIRYGYDAVGTGEALGQASSQTLKNIKVIEESLPRDRRIPILRPLISMDKDEIIKLSKKLGTYDESSKVLELCAITSGPVTTRADLNVLIQESSKIGDDVIPKLIESLKVYDLMGVDVYELLKELTLELDHIPENALVIDVRDKKEFEQWHYPGALSIYDIEPSLIPKDRPIVIYCNNGQISSVWASTLRSEGLKAFSLKGGLGTAKSCSSY
ncbi:MAG: tRNA uracil 4-sulfurtransferase ThiI [Sulfolobales archaeon]